MVNTSNLFKEHIVDGTSPQDFLLVRNVATAPYMEFFSAIDGDFTVDGVTIDQMLGESDDLTFGNCSADTISFSLINDYGKFEGYRFRDMAAYVGVKLGTYAVESGREFPSGALCGVVSELSATATFYGMPDGIYRKIDGGNGQKLYSTPVQIRGMMYEPVSQKYIAVGKGHFYAFTANSIEELTLSAMTRPMVRKLYNGKSVAFVHDTRLKAKVYNVKDNTYDLYEYCPMGIFALSRVRPDRTQNDLIEFNDAPSIFAKMDVSARAFLKTVSYPTDTISMMMGIASRFNATVSFPAGSSYGVDIPVKPFDNSSSYTLREVFGWCLQLMGCNAFSGREIIQTSSAPVITVVPWNFRDGWADGYEEITEDRIESGTVVIEPHEVPKCDYMEFVLSDGRTFGIDNTGAGGVLDVGDNPYVINGNQVMNQIITGLMDGTAPPTLFAGIADSLNGNDAYQTLTATILEADPSWNIGDPAELHITRQKYNSYSEETTVETDVYRIPIMNRQFKWAGSCTAVYEATGNEVRETDSSMPTYKSSYSTAYTDTAVKKATQLRIFQATGSGNTATSLASNTVTQVTLVSPALVDIGDNYGFKNGGIEVKSSGIYRVTGAVYMVATQGGGANSKDVYVRRGDSGAVFADATEVLSGGDNVYTTGQNGRASTVPLATKLITASSGDIFYLACRASGGTGSYYPGNNGTYLLIEKVQ